MNLRKLTIRNNYLNSISNIGNFVNLEEIDLFFNHGITIPDSFSNLKKLSILKIEGGGVTAFPSVFCQLISLEELYITENSRILNLSDDLGNLVNLRIVVIEEESKIKEIPESMQYLQKLEKLVIRNGLISELPRNFTKLHTLRVLDLFGNQLHSLPEDFGLLSNLQEFCLGNNPITKIPDSIGNLSNLKLLNLIYIPELLYIPKSLTNLTHLKEIKIILNDSLKEIGWLKEFLSNYNTFP